MLRAVFLWRSLLESRQQTRHVVGLERSDHEHVPELVETRELSFVEGPRHARAA
jgi:hypothetical protein